MREFLESFKSTFDTELQRIQEEDEKKMSQLRHDRRMRTDQEYKDSYILSLIKEYVANNEKEATYEKD